MQELKSPPHSRINPIARIRAERGLSQAQLAARIGKRQKDIARWETGLHRPNMLSLARLAKALDCTIDELIED